jgi:hypothetical protein
LPFLNRNFGGPNSISLLPPIERDILDESIAADAGRMIIALGGSMPMSTASDWYA